MSWFRIAFLALTTWFTMILSGCCDKSIEEARRQGIEEGIKIKGEEIKIKAGDISSHLNRAFLIGSVFYVCIGLLGPSITEKVKNVSVSVFNIGIGKQVFLAISAYSTVIVGLFLLSLLSGVLKEAKPAVWVLLGGTVYPFFVHVIPSIKAPDKTRRKAAVGQIKSFLVNIVMFYLILKALSPEGLSGFKIF